MKRMVFDSTLCNGCYCCQIACKDEHVENDWRPYAKPQPDTGQFWLKLHEFVRGTVPKVKVSYLPVLCQHCEKAVCLEACSIEGAMYRRDDGLVLIDPQLCIGCKACLEKCPYQAIYFNEQLNIAQKCTGCAHLLDNGWNEPRCVDACPNGALKWVDQKDIEKLNSAQPLHPEFQTKPQMRYLNMPGKFIAGMLYDPIAMEVVEGATCILSGKALEQPIINMTDGFGDFWFDKLSTGSYRLEIKAPGYKDKVFAIIDAQTDMNLGDIPLQLFNSSE